MKNKIIELGVSHSDEESGCYFFNIYRLDKKIKSYLDRLTWSQGSGELGSAMHHCFLCNEQSLEEYSDAKRIDVFPLAGIDSRPAHLNELGNLVSELAEATDTDVLLHTKTKTLEEVNSKFL